jgi:stage V sporulation protein B
MLLTASTLICKVIGLLFKIPIIGIVGIDGMAHFSAAYNIYMLLNSISAAGLPVALSILVSKNIAQGRVANASKTFGVSMSIFASLGIICSVVLYFGADAYSHAIGINEAATAVKAISPTLFFMCIASGIRGYFQGFKIMSPTAVSQLLESFGKLVLGISFAYFAVEANKVSCETAAAAVLGLSVGVLISLVYLIICLVAFNNKKNHLSVISDHTDSFGSIAKAMFYIALPITLSSCITSLTGVADTALITNRLIYGGLSKDVAVMLYSSYSNLAIPLFNLPPALITPISVSLIPSLTASVTEKNTALSTRIFASSVKLCNMLSLPAAAGLAVFSKPILMLIYPSESEACSFAAPLLSLLSVAIVFSCLVTVFNAVLQAYMKPILPILSMLLGAVVKIISEYFLVGSDLGALGAPLSTIACTFTILVFDLLFVNIYTPHTIEYKPIVKTFIAALVSVSLSAVLYHFMVFLGLNSALVLLSVIAFAMIFYAFLVLLMGIISRSDIHGLPFGNKIENVLLKMKLIRE